MKIDNPESDIRILKVGSCLSVSSKSTLTYHIGCTANPSKKKTASKDSSEQDSPM